MTLKFRKFVSIMFLAVATLAFPTTKANSALPIVSSEVKIERFSVDSSALASAGYDAATKTLEIEFLKTGSVYQYSKVPPELYEGLINAPSIGRYYNRNIKGRFPCIRIH